MLKFIPFQREDLARAAMHDGLILSWEPGLGKTFAALAWPLIKQASRCLLVVPGGLHRQFHETAIKHFKLSLTTIKTQRDFFTYRLDKSRTIHTPNSANRTQFFITTYQDLGMNGGDEWLDEIDFDGNRHTPPDLVRNRMAWCVANNQKYNAIDCLGIGDERGGIKCVFTPTLSRLISTFDSFDCVVVDEGTRLQANDSCISQGVRQLDPRYRLVLTGTPIKNRLESMFWLAWWAAGGSAEPTARWPYPGESESREEFANQHLQHDHFLDREEEDAIRAVAEKRSARKFQKRTARICNIHRLWKLCAPIIIRRRKEDCSEEIVAKTIKPIYIQPGTAQLAVYRYHLDNPPVSSKKTPGIPVKRRTQIGMQLNLLRQAALCPNAQSLADSVTGVPSLSKRSWTGFNPKIAACLTLITELLDKGEQVIIGSPFREFSNTLHALLSEARVASVLLDGTTSPKRRGDMADAFKQKRYSVMVAGLNAMGEGHSFECCSNLILPSLSWAFDENEQFTHRVWRINSPKPVTIYPIVMAGTIDERLAQLFNEKGDSAQLALDGRLFAEHTEEIDLAGLLSAAMKNFDPHANTLDEEEMKNQWTSGLKKRLGLSEKQFREFNQPITGSAIIHPDFTVSESIPTALTLAIQRYRACSGK